MPIIILLVLILIVLLGGAPLLWAGLAGATLALFAALPALKTAVMALLAVLFCLAVLAIALGLKNRQSLPKRPGFRVPLSEKFKRTHQVEHGIWKDDMHYIVESGGIPNYFETLQEARLARDTGVIP